MTEQNGELFILGSTGFVGREVVKEALARGFRVKALVRDRAKAADLAAAGAVLVPGDAASPAEWMGAAAKSSVLIDLVQPEVPDRVNLSTIRRIAADRLANTQRLVAALQTLPSDERPLLMSVSGLDDLAPDADGRVNGDSPLRDQPVGFAHIGIPVRRLIEKSELPSTFVYLGTVYGPGKAFARKIFPQLAAGKFRIPGDGTNRMPLVHVEDAARALVHLAGQAPERLARRSFVVADGSDVSMRQVMGSAAEMMGAPAPGTLPLWLVRLALGSVLFETMTRDISASPDGLLASGFAFRYPSPAEGLPPTLLHLGYQTTAPRRSEPAPERRFHFPLWALFVLAIGSMLAVNLLDFPLSVPRMGQLAGGLPLLDMRPGYSAHAVYQLFDVLGANGRTAYLQELWSVDLYLPFVFAWFLSEAIQRGSLRRFRWLGVLAGATDYAENLAITVLLLQYPNHAPTIVLVSATLTLLKFCGYLASMGAALVGYVVKKRERVCRNFSGTGSGPVAQLSTLGL